MAVAHWVLQDVLCFRKRGLFIFSSLGVSKIELGPYMSRQDTTAGMYTLERDQPERFSDQYHATRKVLDP